MRHLKKTWIQLQGVSNEIGDKMKLCWQHFCGAFLCLPSSVITLPVHLLLPIFNQLPEDGT
jgi:hypothetical protein